MPAQGERRLRKSSTPAVSGAEDLTQLAAWDVPHGAAQDPSDSNGEADLPREDCEMAFEAALGGRGGAPGRGNSPQQSPLPTPTPGGPSPLSGALWSTSCISPVARLGSFVRLLRHMRGSVLRAWRIDLDVRGYGRVLREDLQTFCRRCGFASWRAVWNVLRPEGARALEFREVAPKEFDNVRCFVDAVMGSSPLDLDSVWASLSPKGRPYVRLEAFDDGAKKLGFDGNVPHVFFGLDTGGVGKVWREDLRYLLRVGRVRVEKAPSPAAKAKPKPAKKPLVTPPAKSPSSRGGHATGDEPADEDAASQDEGARQPCRPKNRPDWNDHLWSPCAYNIASPTAARIYFSPLWDRPTLQVQREKIAQNLGESPPADAGGSGGGSPRRRRKRDEENEEDNASNAGGGDEKTEEEAEGS